MSAGDSALASITRALNALTRVPARAAADAAAGIADEIKKEFAQGTDPYGTPWPALAAATIARGRSAPPLTDSGALSNVTVSPSGGSGIRIELGESYGAFHQIGTSNMPARPILPTGPLPKAWSAAIDAATKRAFDQTLGGGR